MMLELFENSFLSFIHMISINMIPDLVGGDTGRARMNWTGDFRNQGSVNFTFNFITSQVHIDMQKPFPINAVMFEVAFFHPSWKRI